MSFTFKSFPCQVRLKRMINLLGMKWQKLILSLCVIYFSTVDNCYFYRNSQKSKLRPVRLSFKVLLPVITHTLSKLAYCHPLSFPNTSTYLTIDRIYRPSSRRYGPGGGGGRGGRDGEPVWAADGAGSAQSRWPGRRRWPGTLDRPRPATGRWLCQGFTAAGSGGSRDTAESESAPDGMWGDKIVFTRMFTDPGSVRFPVGLKFR